MSWLLNNHGGYRAGCEDGLTTSGLWRKIVMYGPEAHRCEESTCLYGQILKSSTELPSFCTDVPCEAEECCQAARSCTADVCQEGFLLSLTRPEYCAGVVCTETECCQQKTKCSASVCPEKYISKLASDYPEYGCSNYTCTVDECCLEAPVCEADTCSANASLYLLSDDPLPSCSDFTCTLEDCCGNAAKCDASLCADGYVLSQIASENVTYCKSGVCEHDECCTLKVPSASVTGINFHDADFRSGMVGGQVTWIPPTTTDIITYLSVAVGNSSNTAVFVGQAALLDRTFSIPAGTTWGSRVYIWSCNPAGRQSTPAAGPLIVDSVLEAKDLKFEDLDLDEDDLGGTLTWTEPMNYVDSSVEKEVCLSGRSLSVSTTTYGATFTVGSEQVSTAAAAENDQGERSGVIAVVSLLGGVQGGLTQAVVKTFAVVEENNGLLGFIQLMKTLELGTTILLSAVGIGWSSLPTLVSTLIVGMGGTDFPNMEDGDRFSMVGRAGLAAGSRAGLSEARAPAAGTFVATASTSCLFKRYDVYLSNNDATQATLVGTSLLQTNSIEVAPNTPKRSYNYLTVRAVSSIGRQTIGQMIVDDNQALVSNLEFAWSWHGTEDLLIGMLSWTPPETNKGLVIAYRIFISDEYGNNKTVAGPEVPVGTNRLLIHKDVSQVPHTHLLVYCVSSLGAQSNPQSAEIPSTLTPVMASSMAAAAAVLAIQIARCVASFEVLARIAKATREERAAGDRQDRISYGSEGSQVSPASLTSPQSAESGSRGRPKRYTSPLGTFVSASAHEVISVKGASCWASSARNMCSPLFPSYIHHQQPQLFVRRLGRHLRQPWAGLGFLHHNSDTWCNETVFLRQLSNARILIEGLKFANGKELVLKRQIPCWLRCLEDRSRRQKFQTWTPLLLFMAVAAALVYLEEYVLASCLVGFSLLGTGLLYVLPKWRIVRVLCNLINDLPPARFRAQFWTTIWFIGLLLPVAPALLSNTSVGVTLAVAVGVASVSILQGARTLSLFVSFAGGILFMALALLAWSEVPSERSDDNDELRSRHIACFAVASLLLVQTVDCLVSWLEDQLDETRFPVDEVMSKAERTASYMEIPPSDALALQSFAGGYVEYPLQHRFIRTVLDAGQRLAHDMLQMFGAVDAAVGDLKAGGLYWGRVATCLEEAAFRVLETAKLDYGTDRLKALSAFDESKEHTPEEQIQVADIIEEVTLPALDKFEKVLKHLSMDTLSNTLMADGLTMGLELTKASRKVRKEIQVLLRCVECNHVAYDRPRLCLFHVKAVELAEETRLLLKGIPDMEISDRTVQDLRARAVALHHQARCAIALLPEIRSTPPVYTSSNSKTSASSPGSLILESLMEGIRTGKQCAQRSVDLLSDVLEGVNSIFPVSSSTTLPQELTATLADVLSELEAAEKCFSRLSDESSVEVSTLDEEAQSVLFHEVSARFLGRTVHDEEVQEARQALILVRSCLAMAGGVHMEMNSRITRLSEAFEILEDVKFSCSKAQKRAKKIHEGLPRGHYSDFSRLKDDSSELAMDCFAAVAALREQLREAASPSLQPFRDALLRLRVLLATRLSLARAAQEQGQEQGQEQLGEEDDNAERDPGEEQQKKSKKRRWSGIAHHLALDDGGAPEGPGGIADCGSPIFAPRPPPASPPHNHPSKARVQPVNGHWRRQEEVMAGRKHARRKSR